MLVLRLRHALTPTLSGKRERGKAVPMLPFALARLGLAVPTFVGLTLLAFFLIRIVPGDPTLPLQGRAIAFGQEG